MEKFRLKIDVLNQDFQLTLFQSKIYIYLFSFIIYFKRYLLIYNYKLYKQIKLKNVLITGALGQDGLILSKLFLKKRFKVFGFIKKSNKSKINRVKYKINDLKNKKKLKKDFKEINPNIVIHLASSNNSYIHRKEKDSFKINYLQNIICMKNLLNAIKENNLKTKLVFAGSSLMFKGNLKKKNHRER